MMIFWAAFAVFPPLFAAQSWPPPMPPEKSVRVYGQEIRYYEAGAGPSVILLHGMVGTATDWARTLGPVSRKFHVYALDQIGFGRSSKPLIEYKIATFVDFLQEFMRVKRIPKATVVGNSLGGWIAVDFAATHPELVDRLVLVDASGLDAPVHRNVPVDMNPSSLEGMRKVWELLFYNKDLATDSLVRSSWENRLQDGDSYTIQRLVAALVAGTQFEDSKVGSIRASTLLIWGRNDAVVPMEVGERFQKAIAGSKLVLIDHCGHVPQIEKPAEFNKVLTEFLAGP
ncbi:MAG: alpha/beta fold hydrolase [Terriglobia bacterium]